MLASHLHLPVARVKQETTATQFLEWVVYLKEVKEQKLLTHEKLDYYLAMIACEVRRTLVKDPTKLKVKDFLLDFNQKSEDTRTYEERLSNTKKFWFAFTGMKGSPDD